LNDRAEIDGMNFIMSGARLLDTVATKAPFSR
jgi:hypothetical protein